MRFKYLHKLPIVLILLYSLFIPESAHATSIDGAEAERLFNAGEYDRALRIYKNIWYTFGTYGLEWVAYRLVANYTDEAVKVFTSLIRK